MVVVNKCLVTSVTTSENDQRGHHKSTCLVSCVIKKTKTWNQYLSHLVGRFRVCETRKELIESVYGTFIFFLRK